MKLCIHSQTNCKYHWCLLIFNELMVFLFPILLSSYLDFCEILEEKKIMKSAMGNLCIHLKPLWALYKYPW